MNLYNTWRIEKKGINVHLFVLPSIIKSIPASQLSTHIHTNGVFWDVCICLRCFCILGKIHLHLYSVMKMFLRHLIFSWKHQALVHIILYVSNVKTICLVNELILRMLYSSSPLFLMLYFSRYIINGQLWTQH